MALEGIHALVSFQAGHDFDAGDCAEEGITAGEDFEGRHVVIDGEEGGADDGACVEEMVFGISEELEEGRDGGDALLHYC